MKMKYEMTDETIEFEGKTLHRVKGTDEHGKVHDCGFVEDELNVPNSDEVWFGWDAKILDCGQIGGEASMGNDAVIRDCADVSGKARIYGNVEIREHSSVRGEALVNDNAIVEGSAGVLGYARVFGNSRIKGNAHVGGCAQILGDAVIGGSAYVYGEAKIGKNGYVMNINDYLCIGPIGSRGGFTTFYKTKNDGIYVCCGCFNDSIEKFKKAVLKEHGADSRFGKQYLSAIEFAKSCLDGDKK